MHQVRILNGSLEGNAYAVEGSLLIGRSPDADVQILDTGVSRRHCTLLEDDSGQVILVDLSTNGTIVGGEPINRLKLLAGDVVTIGECKFVLEETDASEPPTEPEVIKLASGPAVADTDVRPPDDLGCGNPLHVISIVKEWDHCPMCGRKITDEDIEAYRASQEI